MVLAVMAVSSKEEAVIEVSIKVLAVIMVATMAELIKMFTMLLV